MTLLIYKALSRREGDHEFQRAICAPQPAVFFTVVGDASRLLHRAPSTGYCLRYGPQFSVECNPPAPARNPMLVRGACLWNCRQPTRVSQQDALLVGGKVQVPPGYADRIELPSQLTRPGSRLPQEEGGILVACAVSRTTSYARSSTPACRKLTETTRRIACGEARACKRSFTFSMSVPTVGRSLARTPAGAACLFPKM